MDHGNLKFVTTLNEGKQMSSVCVCVRVFPSRLLSVRLVSNWKLLKFINKLVVQFQLSLSSLLAHGGT